jgi:hypothetical protein
MIIDNEYPNLMNSLIVYEYLIRWIINIKKSNPRILIIISN